MSCLPSPVPRPGLPHAAKLQRPLCCALQVLSRLEAAGYDRTRPTMWLCEDTVRRAGCAARGGLPFGLAPAQLSCM
jgi:hypothetical protein